MKEAVQKLLELARLTGLRGSRAAQQPTSPTNSRSSPAATYQADFDGGQEFLYVGVGLRQWWQDQLAVQSLCPLHPVYKSLTLKPLQVSSVCTTQSQHNHSGECTGN